jgi:hypothetical protein
LASSTAIVPTSMGRSPGRPSASCSAPSAETVARAIQGVATGAVTIRS